MVASYRPCRRSGPVAAAAALEAGEGVVAEDAVIWRAMVGAEVHEDDGVAVLPAAALAGDAGQHELAVIPVLSACVGKPRWPRQRCGVVAPHRRQRRRVTFSPHGPSCCRGPWRGSGRETLAILPMPSSSSALPADRPEALAGVRVGVMTSSVMQCRVDFFGTHVCFAISAHRTQWSHFVNMDSPAPTARPIRWMALARVDGSLHCS